MEGAIDGEIWRGIGKEWKGRGGFSTHTKSTRIMLGLFRNHGYTAGKIQVFRQGKNKDGGTSHGKEIIIEEKGPKLALS